MSLAKGWTESENKHHERIKWGNRRSPLAHAQTFLWQQQSSAERADKMTVLAIKTSSRIIRIRLKLI